VLTAVSTQNDVVAKVWNTM